MAARKCPGAVFLPIDLPAYQRASARVMATLRAFPVRLEVQGLDEAFLHADA
jgi:DNA polymerase-4